MSTKDSSSQEALFAAEGQPKYDVDGYVFDDPIRGYPVLRWAGKRPFRSTNYYPAQLKDTYGEEVEGWRNELYWGDNLQVMSHLLRRFRGQVDLIYIDPPFDSKADYKTTVRLRGKKADSSQTAFEEKQYSDIWMNDEYLQFMYERLILCRELLSPNGTFFLHCDWHQGHRLRCLLDEIFGPECFQNEIVWHYYNKMQGNVGRFAANHDLILFYSKNSSFAFNKVREERKKPVRQIKRVWSKEKGSIVNAKGPDGKVLYVTSTHKTIDDVWRMSMLQPADRTEAVGYPTQKPESVVERVIAAASNPGDLVFDCFVGSGTTAAVAAKLGRRFICADVNLGAIRTTTRRLLSDFSELHDGQPPPTIKNGLTEGGYEGEMPDRYFRGLNVYTVNSYDLFRNPAQAKDLLVEALEVQPLTGGGVYDGEKDGRLVKIMPVNRIATRQDLNELITNFNYKLFEKRKQDAPNQPVERLLIVCMGHEPDLKAHLQQEVPYKLDVEVVDILRDRADLEFKRDSEARVRVVNGELVIEAFYPMALLQKLSVMKEDVGEWRELVDSVLVDFNYDGVVMQPAVVDVPGRGDMVSGRYPVPEDAGTIRVRITDVLSESWEGEVKDG